MIAVQAALTRIGSPYSWGAAGPGAFDCSGLVMWAFEQAGVYLPHSSQALAQGGQPVSMDQMQPGDLVTYLLRCLARRHLHRRRHDGACLHLRHAGSGRPGGQCADSQRPPVLSRPLLGILLLVELIVAVALLAHPAVTAATERRRRAASSAPSSSAPPPSTSRTLTLRDGRTATLIPLGGAQSAAPDRPDRRRTRLRHRRRHRILG